MKRLLPNHVKSAKDDDWKLGGFTMRASTRLALAWLLFLAIAGIGSAETCLSPFVKRLDRPEKYLYVFCVDADAKDHDSCRHRRRCGRRSTAEIIDQLDLGSAGNETHHFGYTDDRTHIWGCSLFSSRMFLIDVATEPAKPKLEKVSNWRRRPRWWAPLAVRAAGPDAVLVPEREGRRPAGGIGGVHQRRQTHPPDRAAQGRALHVRRRRQARPQPHGDLELHTAEQLQEADGADGLQGLRQGTADLGFPRAQGARKADNGSRAAGVPVVAEGKGESRIHQLRLDDSIWLWEGNDDGKYDGRKLCATGKLPADLRQSPDDRFLYVSCFGSNEIQQWDVSDLKKPKLTSTMVPGVQPNMMHVTGDGKRMYVTNSLLSTLDRSDKFWVRLAHIGPDGMKMDQKFKIDLNKCQTGPAHGHDMLLN